jgi:glc operon protein GlcG
MTFRPMLPASVVLAATAAIAQTTAQPKAQAAAPAPAASSYAIPIGTSVNLDTAKKAAAAASAEAHKNNWFMAIAVVDPAGTLVYYEKADTTQLGSAQVAIDKARSAALYKRPTKAFQDALEKGGIGVRVLRLEGAVPLEGGVPLLVGGKLVGGIGVSGDLSEHDGQCANAGAAALTTTTVAR